MLHYGRFLCVDSWTKNVHRFPEFIQMQAPADFEALFNWSHSLAAQFPCRLPCADLSSVLLTSTPVCIAILPLKRFYGHLLFRKTLLTLSVLFQPIFILLKDRFYCLCLSHRVSSSTLHLFHVITWFPCLCGCSSSNHSIFSFLTTSLQPTYLSESHSRPEFFIKHSHYCAPGISFFAEL